MRRALAGPKRKLSTHLPTITPAPYPPFRLTAACAALWLLVLPQLLGAQNFFKLEDVRPGLHGTGRTVFSGNKIEEFQVEVLGVLQNTGPKQRIILARLSGGPLAETGILQGMSGSPVYIDGKLLGAVALGFPFSKEPIAGIQPIEDMIADSSVATGVAHQSFRPEAGELSASVSYHGVHLESAGKPASEQTIATPFGSLGQLPIPVSVSGFAPEAQQALATRFRTLGFAAFAGLSGAAAPMQYERDAQAKGAIVPGSMISVGLLTGDMNITADGTVTFVDGNKIYAFGHRFLDIGSTELPFASADVVALIPNLNSSFKLSAPRAWVGTILSDRATAVSGELGRSAQTIPLSVTVESSATGTHSYNFQVVNDRFLTPFITQTALASVLDATERTVGRGTLQLEGAVEWGSSLPPLELRDTFVSDSGLVQQVAGDAVVPLAFVLGGGFQNVAVKKMSFHLKANEAKRQLRLAQAWASTHEARPGETIQLTALLEGENGLQMSRTIAYRIPPGVPAGSINFTVSDGNTLNFPEFAGLAQSSSHDAEHLIRTINAFRDSDVVYVRVWRQQPAFTIAGPTPDGELTDPPPSAALILADPSDSATTNPAATATRGSQLAELSAPTRGYVVTGAKTLQVDVKE